MVVVAAVWKQISYNFLFFLAGLQSIPKSLIEAAAIDGAGPVRRFFTIVFPLLSTKKLSGIAEPGNASRMTVTYPLLSAAQRALDRCAAAEGRVLLFAHGHILRVLTGVALSFGPRAGAHFVLVD